MTKLLIGLQDHPGKSGAGTLAVSWLKAVSKRRRLPTMIGFVESEDFDYEQSTEQVAYRDQAEKDALTAMFHSMSGRSDE